MNIAFRTATSGVRTFQQGMDTIANNMANLNTTGFKGFRSNFSEQLYTNMTHYAENQGRDLRTGHGVRQISTDYMFAQGAPVATERLLDFAIVGEGFFGIRTKPDNDLRYTRDGNFSMQLNGSKVNLITGSGDVLTDSKGKALEVPMDEFGNVDHEKLLPMIGIYRFDNPYGLEPVGSNLFMENARSGKGKDAEDSVQLKQGMLEGSNVELAKEMSNVIITQRGFQMNAKIVQVADEMEQIVNTLR